MQSTAASAPEPKTSLENPESVAPSESAEHKRSAASSFTPAPVWIIIIITIIIVPPTATKPLMVLLTPVGSNIRPGSFCKTHGSVHTSQPNHRFREHDGGSKSWIRHSPLPTTTLCPFAEFTLQLSAVTPWVWAQSKAAVRTAADSNSVKNTHIYQNLSSPSCSWQRSTSNNDNIK